MAPSSSKSSGFLRIFFIGLALTLFGTLIGVLTSRFLPISSTATTPPSPAPIVASGTPTFSPELTAEQDATLDPTANWKTFQNSIYNITFKYPGNYTFSENDPLPNDTGNWFIQVMSPLTQSERIDTTINSKELKVEVIIQPKKTKDSLDIFFNEQARTDGNSLGSNSITSIDGIKAIKLNWEGMGNGTSYYVLTKTSRIIITRYPQASERDNEFDQILSTFKFTNQSIITPVTKYSCPSNGWVDCLPGTTPKPECSTEAMNWYKTNCPDFKGAAL